MKFTPQAALACLLLMCILTIPSGEAKRRGGGSRSRSSGGGTYVYSSSSRSSSSSSSGCNSGYYRDDTFGSCRSCPDNCLGPCADGSGECEHGCEWGYRGDECDWRCSLFGQCKCCNQTTGDCLVCADGYYGEDCDESCPRFCLVNGTRTCEKLTGACLNDNSTVYQCPTYSYSGSGGLGSLVSLVILLVTLARWLLTRADC